MGQLADDVNRRLAALLSEHRPALEWDTEHFVAGTPVDVVGRRDGGLVAIELEWKRADPSDNTAKLFRHLSEGSIQSDEVVVCQVFTERYVTESGSVSAKRKNAEFVGRVAAETFDGLSYYPVEFALDPPKRGEPRPDGWEKLADETGGRIAELVSQ